MQFKISVYKLFRHDYKRFGGEIMLYLNEEMPHKMVFKQPSYSFKNAEIICIEFHQLKHKWLLLGYNKPPTQSKF